MQNCLIDCFNGVIGAVYRVVPLFVMQVKIWPLQGGLCAALQDLLANNEAFNRTRER